MFKTINDEYDEMSMIEEDELIEKQKEEEFMRLQIDTKDRKTIKGKEDNTMDPETFTLLDGHYDPYKLTFG